MHASFLARLCAAGFAATALTATTQVSQAAPDQSHPPSRATAIATARTNAVSHAGLTRGQDARVKDAVLDKDGASHVRFIRTYRGLELVGGDFVVHQDSDGDYRFYSGARIQPFSISTRARVAPQRAAERAASTVRYRPTVSTPRLVVLATGKIPRLAWQVNVEGRRANGAPAGTYVFVGARSGQVLARWPSVLNETGTGTGLFAGTVPLETTNDGTSYSLVDATRAGTATHDGRAQRAPVFIDPDNVWGDGSEANAQSAGVDAHYGVATTWDYYQLTFGHTGMVDRKGVGPQSFVHDGDYANASWSDSCFCMRYGDGDSEWYPYVSLDIAGHEMTHGITSRTAGLRYKGESGGLNEASSDILGTGVEFYAANGADPADYVIGEETSRIYNPVYFYIRRMDRPFSDGHSLDCYSAAAKSVDVHYSSGVANHFFYLLAEGSGAKTINGIAHDSPTCDGSTITGIGRDAAQQIWYSALTNYMTSRTNYAGARAATIAASTDLYGAASPQTDAVAAAWSAVSVPPG